MTVAFIHCQFWANVCKSVRPMLSDRCLYVCLSVCLSVFLSCPVCNVGVLWPNGLTDQDETWHAGRPRPWPHCVRWGLSSPSPKGHSPQFSAHILAAKWLLGPCLLWPNGWMDQDGTWHGGRPQPRGLCVRWDLSLP